MDTKAPLTHAERVALFKQIIETRMPEPLTDFSVAYMRARAPSEVAMRALNQALVDLGWTK